MRFIAAFLVPIFALGCASVPSGTPEVTVAQLSANLAQYDGRLVLVRGQVSYGFEDCYIDGLWYWSTSQNCYSTQSNFDAWSGNGYVLGVLSTKVPGHLGLGLSLTNARAWRQP